MNVEKYQELKRKYEELLKRHNEMSDELLSLQFELQESKPNVLVEKPVVSTPPVKAPETPENFVPADIKSKPSKSRQWTGFYFNPKIDNVEKFIGENLISKIGILVTIIGAFIGVKYAIDHSLLNPLTRAILGYLLGIGLLGAGFKLREKYFNLSSVLVSGACTILYFVTFACHAFLDLIPQIPAFAIMVVITAFTVFAALNYNRRIIAILGLVGAYAVPFLLSDGSGAYVTLFSYILLINSGILIIAFKKRWNSLFHTAFAFTWLIYLSWYGMSSVDTLVPLGFALAFMLQFLTTYCIGKIKLESEFHWSDLLVIILNAAIIVGVGLAQLDDLDYQKYDGLFTLSIGVIHFAVAYLVFNVAGSTSLMYLLAAVAMAFLTAAIPLQLDGQFVTLLTVLLGGLIYWVGTRKGEPLFTKFSYPILIWSWVCFAYDLVVMNTPDYAFWNFSFYQSLIYIAILGLLIYDMVMKTLHVEKPLPIPVSRAIRDVLFIGATIGVYWTLNREIGFALRPYPNILELHVQFIFTIVFATLLVMASIKINLNLARKVCFFGLIITLFLILTTLLEVNPSIIESVYAWVRIPLYAAVLLALFMLLRLGKVISSDEKLNVLPISEIASGLFLLGFCANELLGVSESIGADSGPTFGLSILATLFSVGFISLGIWKKKRHLRIMGFVILSITLLKLFFNDLNGLSGIARTMLLIAVGLLMLVISYLYNRFNKNISNE